MYSLISLEDSLNSLNTPTASYLRRSLSVIDIVKYSTLQDEVDIDLSIEARAKAEADDDKCSSIFLYLPDKQRFGNHGHGSQLNNYIVAALVGTYLDRNVLLLDPPNDESRFDGGSQFGCPVDAFEPIHLTSPAPTSEGQRFKQNFPGGLSRLVDHPTWLSGGCPIPCADTFTYDDWLQAANRPDAMAAPITCTESDGRKVNVVAAGGGNMRDYYIALQNLKQLDNSEQWAHRLGATTEEAKTFSELSSNRVIFDYAQGLMNKAGFLRLQPWIARDVEEYIKSFDLFQKIGATDKAYDAIHVRRGDKLIHEAHAAVIFYWRFRGHTDPTKLPTNYIPVTAYLETFKKRECPVNEQGEVTERMKRNVFVATDDPVVVKQEIASLPNHIDERTILWDDCHELTFYFSPPSSSSAFHLNGDGEDGFKDGTKDNCFMRYHRNIASVADMVILGKARTFM